MKEFIEYLIKNLVDQPENVAVNCYERERDIVIEIRVEALDIGKVIGRKGMTINALRTISSMIGARLGRRVRIDLAE